MNNLSSTVTDLFGVPTSGPVTVSIGDGCHPHTPKKIEGYVFRRDLVRNLLAFENRSGKSRRRLLHISHQKWIVNMVVV